jgi:methionyl aminopeptidase
MEKEEKEKYFKAAEILKEAQEKAKKMLKEDVKILEVAESIEKLIEEKGAKPAFPANLSFNNEAAHNTPSINDERTLKSTDLLKVDLGAQIDGFIVDASFSINLSNEFNELIKATENALNEGIKAVKEDLSLGEIGERIENTIKEAGFKPIQNLTGHGLEKYNQHAKPSIPNISKKDERHLSDGVYAIEPFATNAIENFVVESSRTEIYGFNERKPLRDLKAKKILEFAEKNKLPFAERWLQKLNLSEFERKIALKQLIQTKALNAFPVLKVKEGFLVAQSETTILIDEGKIIKLL